MKKISNQVCSDVIRLLESGAWNPSGSDKERNDARKARISARRLRQAKDV